MTRGIALAFCVIAAISLSGQTFRVGVEAVRVDVLVTDGNRPVAGLKAEDFELRDRGVVQDVTTATLEEVPLSVMLVFDTSGSVEGEPLVHLKQAATALVRLLKPADRAALLTFSADLTLQAPWTGDRTTLEQAVNSVSASGGTGLHDAAYTALTLRDEHAGRPLILIFSDGEDTVSWLPGTRVIDAARRSDAVVYTVGLHPPGGPVAGYRIDFRAGLQLDIPPLVPEILMQPFLPALAEETGGKYVAADRSAELQHAFVQIVNEFRTRYLLTYTPRGVDTPGWHPIEVKVKGRRLRVTARRGYQR